MAGLPVVASDANELPKPLPARGLSSFVLACIGLLTASNVDMIVAFSTSYWATWSFPQTNEHGGYGLWKVWVCSQTDTQNQQRTSLVKKMLAGSVQTCTVKQADLSFPGAESKIPVHVHILHF